MKFRIIACVVVIAIMASLMNSASAEYQGNSDKWYEKPYISIDNSKTIVNGNSVSHDGLSFFIPSNWEGKPEGSLYVCNPVNDNSYWMSIFVVPLNNVANIIGSSDEKWAQIVEYLEKSFMQSYVDDYKTLKYQIGLIGQRRCAVIDGILNNCATRLYIVEDNDYIPIVFSLSEKKNARIEEEYGIINSIVFPSEKEEGNLDIILYLDVKSENNAFLSTYDMDIALDGKVIGTVKNGETLTYKKAVTKGRHEVIAYKASNYEIRAGKYFEVNENLTFKATIAHSSNIEFKEAKLLKGLVGASLTVPDVTEKRLSDAKKELQNKGFVNILAEPENDIWADSNWYVLSQNISAGSSIDKNERIVLECVKIENYISDLVIGKNLSEIDTILASTPFSVAKYDSEVSEMKEKAKNIKEYDKENWACKRVYYNGDYKVTLYVEYLGTPEEREAEAANERLYKTLEAYLPVVNAKKAIIVAFTNLDAEDVFTADGNYYDKSKFHGYNYNGDYKQQIQKDGIWTAITENTWHVDNIYLKLKSFSLITKICCDVSYDGNYYYIRHVRNITGTSISNIDSEDPAKTSGWQTMEPGDFYNMLIIPASMVTGDAGMNKSYSVIESDNYGTNTEYENWVGNQFSFWDGDHKELTKLIKKSLNDEKSFKHIKTTHRECTNQAAVDAVNNALRQAGFSQTVQLNDILITTEFSAKNRFNATVKSTAVGISHYKNNTIVLVGFLN